MDDACGEKASLQRQVAFTELFLGWMNLPVFVQVQPELVRSASGPTRGGEDAEDAHSRENLPFVVTFLPRYCCLQRFRAAPEGAIYTQTF